MVNASCKNIILILFLFTNSSLSQNLTKYHDNYDLADVTLFIIREHLSLVTSKIIILSEYSNSLESPNNHFDFINYLLLNLQHDISVRLGVDEQGNHFIFIVDSFDAFKTLYRQIPERHGDRLFYFLVILTKETSDWRNTMEQIFEDCYHFNVLNVNIIVRQSSKISMYTYMIFLENSCRYVKSTILFSFDRNYEELKELFPKKLKNFHKCPIRVAIGVASGPPFFIFKGNTSDPKPVGNWENLSGLEGTLLKYLSQCLNFTLEFVPFLKERSYVDKNGSYGTYAELMSGRADIAVGGFSGADANFIHFSQSEMYIESRIKHVVRGKILSPFSRLGRPFNHQLWLFVGGFVLWGTFTIFMMKFVKPTTRHLILGKRSISTVLNFLSLLVGNAVTGEPRRNFARFLLLMLLFLNFVLRSAYLGSLYEVIWVNKTYAKPPSNLDELIKEGYIFLLPPDIAYLNVHPKNHIMIVNDSFTKRLKQLEVKDGNYATVILHQCFADYKQTAVKSHRESDLLLTNEVVFVFPVTMFFVKNAVILEVFNKILQRLGCSGIISELEKDYDFDLRSNKKGSTQSKVKLTIQHLEAVYEIFLYLTMVAIVVFLLEIISLRCRKLKQIFDWMMD